MGLFVFGLVLGSFAGVIVDRLPREESPWSGRSRCGACGRDLTVAELVPLLSFAIQRGRCRACAAPIPGWLPVIELLCGMFGAMAGLSVADWEQALPLCVLGAGLTALAWLDARHYWLPDVLTLPLAGLGLVTAAGIGRAAVETRLAGAVLGYALLAAIAVVYRRLRGRDGLGRGDAKLLAVGGAWAGPWALPAIILGAALIGIGLGLWRLARDRSQGAATMVPFGACLAPVIYLAALGWLPGF